MDLPFSQEQFFGVMADYNVAVWPAQFAAMMLAIAMVVLVVRVPERAGRPVSYGLALLWSWMALAYHLAFFWSIPCRPVLRGYLADGGSCIRVVWRCSRRASV